MNNEPILVAAAAIVDDRNRVLVTQRAAGTHQGGKWEFPGGKCEAGESIQAALDRELMEELGIIPDRPEHLITLTHAYPGKTVTLSVWKVRSYTGALQGREGQPLLWQPVSELNPELFPAADYGIIRALQLPEFCAITPDIQQDTEARFLNKIEKVLDKGIRLLILRNHILDHAAYTQLARQVCNLCESVKARCMLNMPVEWLTGTDSVNLHLSSFRLLKCDQRPNIKQGFLSASCHNTTEIRQAEKIGVDFILLSPVNITTSHPDAGVLGWDKFENMVQNCSVPVYALGGLGRNDLNRALSCGAQGIAGITGFWDTGS
jgi:8-oxo-dGTP diphosphatase